jgi:hypothetical protein
MASGCVRNQFDQQRYEEIVEDESPTPKVDENHDWMMSTTKTLVVDPSGIENLKLVRIFTDNPAEEVSAEIVDDAYPNLELEIDPKLSWALRHPEHFPVDINKADYEMILRVPGIGVKSAKLIVASRRFSKLGFYELKKIGVVMKKAQYFITCSELPSRTVNELTPLGVRKLLLPSPKKRKTDDRQLMLNFEETP